MSYPPQFVSVHTKGSAEAVFSSVAYKADVVMDGNTGPEAKAKARPVIDRIRALLVERGPEAGIDLSRLKTSFEVSLITTHGNDGVRRFGGYRASYSISFTGTDVVKSIEFHDALTSIEHVQASSPDFRMDDLEAVSEKAFANAVSKAQRKFIAQCKALSLDPNKYIVHSWDIRDEEPRGKFLSVQEDMKAQAVGIEPGKAVLDVRVTVNFTIAHTA